MTRLEEMLAANKAYCENPPVDYTGEDVHESKLPRKKIAVFTCMDTRLVELLEPALGLKRGDAKFVKTVGNTLVGPFDGVVRSLMVATYELGIEEIFVVGHDECGMAKTTAQGLLDAMHAHGVKDEDIAPYREELVHWADSFSHPVENVREVVQKLRENPFLPKSLKVHGLLLHPRSGKIDLIVNGDA
ncbi:carbonic anhydrase [Selenomonas sputigena]|uniref:carbonic anhydrase n=1 Tax=Selenomonas sputigena TaxID=69823 RepID=A0ABV3XA73_9FIRM